MNQIFEPADLVEQTLFTLISWLPACHRILCVRPDGRFTDLHRDVASSVVESERLIEDMATEEDFKEGIAALVEEATGLAFGALTGS